MASACAVRRNQAYLLKRAARGWETPTLQVTRLLLGLLKTWPCLVGNTELGGWEMLNWTWEHHLGYWHWKSSSFDFRTPFALASHQGLFPPYTLVSLFPQVLLSLCFFAFVSAALSPFCRCGNQTSFKVTWLVSGRAGIRTQFSMTQKPELLATQLCYLPNFGVSHSTCCHIIS